MYSVPLLLIIISSCLNDVADLGENDRKRTQHHSRPSDYLVACPTRGEIRGSGICFIFLTLEPFLSQTVVLPKSVTPSRVEENIQSAY